MLTPEQEFLRARRQAPFPNEAEAAEWRRIFCRRCRVIEEQNCCSLLIIANCGVTPAAWVEEPLWPLRYICQEWNPR